MLLLADNRNCNTINKGTFVGSVLMIDKRKEKPIKLLAIISTVLIISYQKKVFYTNIENRGINKPSILNVEICR